MEFQLTLIGKNDYPQLLRLIVNNQNRLIRYFPNTVKNIHNKKEIQKQLKENSIQKDRKEQYLFGLYDHQTLVGYINIKNVNWDIKKCEIGYFIDKSYAKKGIMTNIIKNICHFCFNELHLLKIYLRIAKENIASKKIAEKNGFILEGVLRNEFKIETGEIIDVEYYGKLSTD